MRLFVILGLLAYISASLADRDQETLVLVDNLNIRETHSQFFKSLQGKILIIVYRPSLSRLGGPPARLSSDRIIFP